MNAPLLPQSPAIRLDALTINGGIIVLIAATVARNVHCPICGCATCHVHSRYQRTLLDLPWQGQGVRIEFSTRKFFCDNPQCVRRIFTERLPKIATPYARKTERLADALRELAFLAGGEAAAKIARTFGLILSPDSLLDSLKKAPLPPFPPPRVLGMDDFAFKKGHRYGTILVDLERHCPVDLLPDRDADSVAAWLEGHPGIQIITRDRGATYKEGATRGAPHALQVADRWHLLKNLGDTVEMALRRHHKHLSEIVRQPDNTKQTLPLVTDEKAPQAPLRAQREKALRHEVQQARYNQLKKLHQQGLSVSALARQVGMSRKTVRKYLQSPTCPFYSARRPRSRLLAPFEEYLKQRWIQGCHNAAGLYEEIVVRGYRGKQTMVKDYLHRFRASSSEGGGADPRSRSPGRVPAASSVRWWLLGHWSKSENQAHWQRGFVERLVSVCPEIKRIQDVAVAFVGLVRERREEDFSAWLERAHGCSAWEMRAFARGLMQDEAAVRAALSHAWSNGQSEGQVNRLKFVKRSMYGRAGLDLLRTRVLHRAAV